MLWSLVKIVVFVAIVAALALGADWLVSAGGGLRIAIANYELNLGPLQTVLVVILALVALWILLKIVGFIVALIRFVTGDETAISRYFDRNRQRKGFQALTDAIMAMASGEPKQAMAKAARAEKYLERPELTSLVTAQAADMSGDHARAEAAYRRLLKDDRTRFVGVRGLMKQKLAEGDIDTALGLARHAFALKPRHQEVQDTLLSLQAQTSDWKGARATLAEKARHGGLPRDVVKRRDAVLALGEAKEVFAQGNTIEAREAAISANKASPDLIPAAVLAADTYVADGKPKLATRVIRKAWEARPHPDLAAAFARIQPDETPEERLKRFEMLIRIHPEDPESRLLQAELSIAAGDFPAARRALGGMVEDKPNSRVLALMAAIERGSGADDAVVRGWLARALIAPRGPQWVCDKCGTVHDHWSPVCSNCGAFDTLAWRQPDGGDVGLPGSAEMLPLIVGAASGQTTPATVTPDEDDGEGSMEAGPR